MSSIPTAIQQRAQYSGLEGKLKRLFGNCDNLYKAYETKHNELKQVFEFLKILAGQLGDISVSIKKGVKCDNIVDEILKQLRDLIENREKEDKIQQDTLGELQKSQKKIMGEVETIKKNVDDTLLERQLARDAAEGDAIEDAVGLHALIDSESGERLGGSRYSQKIVSRKRNKRRRRRKTKNRRRRK